MFVWLIPIGGRTSHSDATVDKPSAIDPDITYPGDRLDLQICLLPFSA